MTTMVKVISTVEISRRPVGKRFAITWAHTLVCGCVVAKETPARGCWEVPFKTIKHTH